MFAGDVGAFDNGSEFMYHSFLILLLLLVEWVEKLNNIVFVDINKAKEVNFR